MRAARSHTPAKMARAMGRGDIMAAGSIPPPRGCPRVAGEPGRASAGRARSGMGIADHLILVLALKEREEGLASASGLASAQERRESVLGEGHFLDRVERRDQAVDDREAAVE